MQMSKINRIRIMNLNYNSNTIKIDDEMFDLNGETTLLSLRNGGGKTVLVQMVISLFVNSSYRNFTDRPFKSYFTTNHPTFVISEWKLDHDNGYFLAGMMVKKCQNLEENNNEDLDIITFTGSYKGECDYCIDTLPLIDEQDGKRVLKGFGGCKKVFDELKMNPKSDFTYYDMSSQHYRRQYFLKLKEYQIDNREWESIIKKVNLKESGLSELFTNAKDERGLIENWLLDAIQNKLNSNKDRVKEFQKIAYKLVQQYKDNQVSIKRRDIITMFFEDAKEIRQYIEKYVDVQNDLNMNKSKIANFIKEVNIQIDLLERQYELETNEMNQLKALLIQIYREEISYQIHNLEKRKGEAVVDRLEVETKIAEARNHQDKALLDMCRYECAGLYEELKEFDNERIEIQSKIKIASSEQKDTKCRVDELGAQLFLYYNEITSKTCLQLSDLENTKEKLDIEKQNLDDSKEKQEDELSKLRERRSLKQGETNSYNDIEKRYNQRFNESLIRNILGEYEEGLLNIKQHEYEVDEQTANRNCTITATTISQLEQECTALSSEADLLKEKKFKADTLKSDLEKEKTDLYMQRQKRLSYMKYVEAPESELDEKIILLSRFDEKIQELDADMENTKEELKECQKERSNLSQGKVIEIPNNVKEYFANRDISYLYGMDWLKNNGRTVIDNQKLVKDNPFIPYSIIMDKNNIRMLKDGKEEVFTNFPIPIVLREELEQNLHTEGGYVSIAKINFFVAFNHHLLDENHLKEILQHLDNKIDKLNEKLNLKKEDIDKFRDARLDIEHQTYSEDRVNDNKSAIAKVTKELNDIAIRREEINLQKRDKLSLKEEKQKLLRELNRKLDKIENRKSEFANLVKDYEVYCCKKEEILHLGKAIDEALNNINLLKVKIDEVEQQINDNNSKHSFCESELKQYNDSLQHYVMYEEQITMDKYDNLECNIVAIEEEFKSLTQGVSRKIEDLQNDLKKTNERYNRKEAELKQKNHYQFEISDYENLVKTESIMNRLQHELEQSKKAEDDENAKNTKLTETITKLDGQIKARFDKLLEKTGSEVAIEEKKIVNINFKERTAIAEFQIESKNKDIIKTNHRKQLFEQTSSVMEQFDGFMIDESIETVQLSNMGEAEIKSYQSDLRKEYQRLSEELRTRENEAETVIRNYASKIEYQDDYFRKCFDNLIATKGNAFNLIKQLDVNCQAYETTVKKLLVDLEMIEKERATVEESFLEYTKSIDDNMRMIDKNSTITIRGRNLKMLKIYVPDWDSNQERYRLKMKDYVEHFIKRGIETVEENKNVEEVLGTLITTKKIYQEIVGINNIEIKMYKIEAEREVLIMWSEVSANSGGEGFLSAFVILSCLLSYMRRDDTNLFEQGEEGKVLIMDNPFAQTYSTHLLKPLMDIAKKTNTQLICLSGLGGDSIYNRFDNIYVLKLKQSSLKKGVSYMDTEHIKGNEIKKMQSSQFKIEQMSLFDIQ